MWKTGYIYKISNCHNNKLYIGSSSKHYLVRYGCHLNDAFYKFIKNKFYNFMRINQINDFSVELLEIVNYDDLDELYFIENEYIKKFDSINNGYNSHYWYDKNKRDYQKKYKLKNKNKFVCELCWFNTWLKNNFWKHQIWNKHINIFNNCNIKLYQ